MNDNNDKVLKLEEAYRKYINKMQQLIDKKLNIVMDFRKKIDEVILAQYRADIERKN